MLFIVTYYSLIRIKYIFLNIRRRNIFAMYQNFVILTCKLECNIHVEQYIHKQGKK